MSIFIRRSGFAFYRPNSARVSTLTHANAGATRLVATKAYDNLNRLAAITHALSAAPGPGHTYSYNGANLRTRATREDNSYWSYGYDALGQVTGGNKFLADNTPALGLAYVALF